MASKLHTLDKKTRDRHFPELNGGKGSYPRTSTKESREIFKANFDAIDWGTSASSESKSSESKSYIKSGN